MIIKLDVETKSKNYEDAFLQTCENGHLEAAKQLVENIPNTINHNKSFSIACFKGHLELAKWLLEIKSEIDISDEHFKYACMNGHLEIVKWLVSIEPNFINSIGYWIFLYMQNPHLENTNRFFNVVKWLVKTYLEIINYTHLDSMFEDACENNCLLIVDK